MQFVQVEEYKQNVLQLPFKKPAMVWGPKKLNWLRFGESEQHQPIVSVSALMYVEEGR